MTAGAGSMELLAGVLSTLCREGGSPSPGQRHAVRRLLRAYHPETIGLIARGLAAGVSGDELFRVLVEGRATETLVREYAEFARSVPGSDPDEMWALIRALHRYPTVPEFTGVGDFTMADERTKAICRSLLAVVHAAYDLSTGVITYLRSEDPAGDYEPVIVHEGLLDLIRAHPTQGEWIADLLSERGIDGLESVRAALEDGTRTAIADGAL